MPEAVIVATARSPIGRANKGSMISIRPDDLSAQIVRALMAKVPQVSADDVEDLLMGCGQPAGEQGFNIARVAAILAGLDDVPGATVNRYCSSSLQTIRMAAHAIKAGEGDCFIAAGVECVSRYGLGVSDTAPNPIFKDAGARTQGPRRVAGQPSWDLRRGPARHLHRHGPDRRERGARPKASPARRWTPTRSQSQQRAGAAIASGFFEREITPITLPDGTVVVDRRLPPPEHHGRGPRRAEAGVPPRRQGHGRQRLPAERRRRRGDGDERHQGQGARAHPARPVRRRRACRGSTPRSWASARSRPAARRSPAPG